MSFRKIISLSILISFSVMLITGVMSFYQPYSRVTATVHTVFGLVFSLGVLGHIYNNVRPLKGYAATKWVIPVLLGAGIILASARMEIAPIKALMDQGATLKAGTKRTVESTNTELITMSTDGDLELTIDLLAGEHYWHPQMAVWTETPSGEYIETIFVSKATAQGLFYGGRSKENFKEFDASASESTDYRRVNALPIWSHKRNVQYSDGMYVPTQEEPLPDGITGATIQGNFQMNAASEKAEEFVLKIEINVAFDDNEYYSEFDFPEDDEFHAGTGQLGQPSILYAADIDMNDDRDYYLMELIGRGHHSAQHGDIITDLSTLTTAKQIVERIVVKAENADRQLASAEEE